jgi:hypothetical protein
MSYEKDYESNYGYGEIGKGHVDSGRFDASFVIMLNECLSDLNALKEELQTNKLRIRFLGQASLEELLQAIEITFIQCQRLESTRFVMLRDWGNWDTLRIMQHESTKILEELVHWYLKIKRRENRTLNKDREFFKVADDFVEEKPK